MLRKPAHDVTDWVQFIHHVKGVNCVSIENGKSATDTCTVYGQLMDSYSTTLLSLDLTNIVWRDVIVTSALLKLVKECKALKTLKLGGGDCCSDDEEKKLPADERERENKRRSLNAFLLALLIDTQITTFELFYAAITTETLTAIIASPRNTLQYVDAAECDGLDGEAVEEYVKLHHTSSDTCSVTKEVVFHFVPMFKEFSDDEEEEVENGMLDSSGNELSGDDEEDSVSGSDDSNVSLDEGKGVN
eukprot:gene43039-53411_t